MQIRQVAIIGAGTMGRGIAGLAALASYQVRLCDLSYSLLTTSLESVREDFHRLVELGSASKADTHAALQRIVCTTSLVKAVASTDLVVECLPEQLDLKQGVFKELDKCCPPAVILATNTSGLSPSALARELDHPERIVVTHFWNPPQLIPLVEVVPGKLTSAETMERTVAWVTSLGRQPVRLKKECPGFIGNRLQLALLREAIYLVEQGYADIEEVDKAVTCGHGRRLAVTGPFCSADMGGLDVFYNIATYLFADLSNASAPSALLQKLVNEGALGMKSGKGFYEWTPDKKEAVTQSRVELLVALLRAG